MFDPQKRCGKKFSLLSLTSFNICTTEGTQNNSENIFSNIFSHLSNFFFLSLKVLDHRILLSWFECVQILEDISIIWMFIFFREAIFDVCYDKWFTIDVFLILNYIPFFFAWLSHEYMEENHHSHHTGVVKRVVVKCSISGFNFELETIKQKDWKHRCLIS